MEILEAIAAKLGKSRLYVVACQGHPGQQAESACRGTVKAFPGRFQDVSDFPGALQAVGTHIYSGRDGQIQRVEVRFQQSLKFTPYGHGLPPQRPRNAGAAWYLFTLLKQP